MGKKFLALFIMIILVVSAAPPAYAATDESDSKIIQAIDSTFEPKYGEIYLKLQPGFDFLDDSSDVYNPDLALTGLALSERVYGDTADTLLKKLGYDYAKYYYHTDLSGFVSPTVCIGYKELFDEYGRCINVFTIAVRGSLYLIDYFTDVMDGAVWMFEVSTQSVLLDFADFINSEEVNKTAEILKKEKTYFFITGHSLGAAVANCLSVNEHITDIATEKGRIYTYTYEAPHTCIDLIWMDVKGMSNAYNFKDVDDFVANVPPYPFATRYGTTLEFSTDVSDKSKGLKNSVFRSIFPNAKGKTLSKALDSGNYGSCFGHHDMGLDLTYIIQKGIDDGYWDSVDEVVVPKSDIMQTRTMLNIETGEFEEVTYDASKVMQWDDFVAAYPDVVCILKLSGEEFEEYTESMWIYEFQLRDSDGNLLERAGAFNITGYDGTDPVGWGETYGPITYQSSDGYDSYTYYIRYQDTIVMGPASIEINTYTAPTPDEDNVLFNTIAGKTFSFSSGMGGWATTMVINADGTFTGEYYDEEYDAFEENSIILYQCSFSGKFSTPGKVSDCEYVMYLESLETEQEPGTEYSEYDDAGYKITHKYTDPYGLDGAREIRVYLPEAPTSDLPEKFLGWLSMRGDAGTELGYYGLYNVNSGQSFFTE